MKVELNRVDKAYHFEGIGESGIAIHIDGSKKIGGNDLGARPMELVLMALGSCASMDLISILTKQRQELVDLKIEISGERNYELTPAVFKKIDVHFMLYGKLDSDKVKKAVELSTEKYCSVAEMLNKTAEINHTFEIIEE